MEKIESPLDVLSRAATMVQDNQPAANEENTKQTSTKQLPTTKWKRDRRLRLPEYSRKSDPKLPENAPPELCPSPSSPTENPGHVAFANGHETKEKSKSNSTDAPIDMSVRQRGLPPSYLQTINNPGYRPNYRPTVITQNPSSSPDSSGRSGVRNDLPSGISMCDPIIDEHFRRSLGKDYLMLYSNNNKSTTPLAENSPEMSDSTTRELIDFDAPGLSVDDHFAKALGDTWIKLNQKDSDIKNSNSSNEKPTIVSL